MENIKQNTNKKNLNYSESFMIDEQIDPSKINAEEYYYYRKKYQEYRKKLLCPICKSNEKNCILPCFHLFCRECIDKNLKSR